MECFVKEGGRYLAVRLAVHQARAYRRLSRVEDEIQAILSVQPLLGQVEHEWAAIELCGRLAELWQKAGKPAAETLAMLESATRVAP